PRHRRALAPDHRDAAARRVPAEFYEVHVLGPRDGRLHGERRKERDADVRGDHLPQRFEARGAEARFLGGARELTDLERLVAQAMAVLEQQKALIGEIVELEARLAREFVALGDGEQERLLEQEFAVKLIVVDRQREDRGVEAAFAQLPQHDLGFLLDEQQFEPREAFADARDHVRQQVRPERREDAEPDRSRFGIERASRDRADLLDFVEHLARALGDLAADVGEQHLARRALDERHAELILELLDLRGEGRLAHEARFGGAAEMLVFRERHQISEIAQVHRLLPSVKPIDPIISIDLNDSQYGHILDRVAGSGLFFNLERSSSACLPLATSSPSSTSRPPCRPRASRRRSSRSRTRPTRASGSACSSTRRISRSSARPRSRASAISTTSSPIATARSSRRAPTASSCIWRGARITKICATCRSRCSPIRPSASRARSASSTRKKASPSAPRSSSIRKA